MANWEVKAYIFEHTATPTSESWITVSTITDVISGKLTLTLNDTSKLSVTVPTRTHSNIEPVKVLLEVKHGNDRKFFGTVTKVTKDIVNGTMKVDAVGVLGSYQFLPNYMGYADSANLNGLISCESQRFRGYYSSGDPHYVASPWEEVYTPMGDGKIPGAFGYLEMSTYNSMHTTCNLDKVKRNAKNAYDFLKTVTKESNYSLPTEMANPSWFKWIEDGEIARFKPISGYNTQYISYKQNLMSCTMATSPHKSRVWCYWNDGAGTLVTQDQTGSDYPNPFYYARKALPNKDDGSPYIAAEVANACYNELHEQDTLVEATAFDQHLVDNSVPWLDMGKIAIIIYYDNYAEQSAQAQITQIEYDLVDSSRDRVKLGKMVSSVTDSLGMSASEVAKQIEEYLPRAGGQMEGAITYDGGTSLDENELKIRGRIFGTGNLLDSSFIEQGGLRSSNGEFVPTDLRAISCIQYIEVLPNTPYTISFSGSFATAMFAYNSSKEFINYQSTSGLVSSATFTTPNNCHYVRMYFSKAGTQDVSPSDISNVQLEEGTSASPYTPYAMDNVELTERSKGKKIYFTPNYCSSNATYDGCYYYKENDIVHVHIGADSPTSLDQSKTMFTLPVGYRIKGATGITGISADNSFYTPKPFYVWTDFSGSIYFNTQASKMMADFSFLAEL